jgi:hypothetical protein
MPTATEHTHTTHHHPIKPSVGEPTLHTWAGDTQVPDCALSDSPSAVVFKDKLYVFYQGSGDSGDLWYNSFYADKWAPSDTKVPISKLSSAPSVAVWNDKIYVFHQGAGDSGNLWYNAYDGNSWDGEKQVDGSRLSSSPAAVVFGGKLFVFHQGSGNNGDLRYNVLS